MDAFTKVYVFHVPLSVKDKEVIAAVQQLAGSNAKIVLCNKAGQTDSECNWLIELSSSEAALKVAKAEALTFGEKKCQVDMYKDKAIINQLTPRSKVISGFEGTEEELKQLVSQVAPVKDIKLNTQNNTFLVIFQTADAAKQFVEKQSELKTDKELKVQDSESSFISFISPTSNASSNPGKLPPGPLSVVIKGQALTYLESDEQLRKLCEPFDKIEKAFFTTNPVDHRRSGWVLFSTAEGAQKAIAALHNKPLPLDILPRAEGSDAQSVDKIKGAPIRVENVVDRSVRKDSAPTSVPTASSDQIPSAVPETVRNRTLWITHESTGWTNDNMKDFLKRMTKAEISTCSVRYKQGNNKWSAIVTVPTDEDAHKILECKFTPALQFHVDYFKPKPNEPAEAFPAMQPPVFPPGYPYPMPYPPDVYPPPGGMPPPYPYIPQMGLPQMQNQRSPYGRRLPRGRQQQQQQRTPSRVPQPHMEMQQQPLIGPHPSQRQAYPVAPNFRYPPQPHPMQYRPELQQPIPPQPLVPEPVPGLNIEELEKKPEDEQHEEVGEFIYNRAKELHGEDAAPRIAGMLLEFPFQQLKPLLEKPELLDRNIEEAFKVIQTPDN